MGAEEHRETVDPKQGPEDQDPDDDRAREQESCAAGSEVEGDEMIRKKLKALGAIN